MHKNEYQTLFTYKNIYNAYIKCKRKKKNKKTHVEFFYNLEDNLYQLYTDLKTANYKIGKYICFVLKDPCIREVFAGNFRDRVVHHLLINEIESYFENYFIYSSFSCRKNKGIHIAVKKLQSGINSLERKNSKIPFFIKLDISSFFMSIDKNILYEIIKKYILKIKVKYSKSNLWQNEILYLCRIIIFNNPTDNYEKKGDCTLFNKVQKSKSLFHVQKNKGLPIGNLTSQFFANVYLNELDQFIKRELKCRYYYRYVDDFVILNIDKKKLKEITKEINIFLQENLKLKLNQKKIVLQSCDKGINFLGYIVRSKYILLRNRTAKKVKNKVYNFIKNKYKYNYNNIKIINASLNSYFSVFRHAKTWKLKEKIKQQLKK